MKHTIILPDLGQTTSEAKIVKWLKAVGERIAAGEPLLEVETDKATMDVEAYVGGYLRKKLAREGEVVSALSPVAILTDTPDEVFEEEVKAAQPQTVIQTGPKPAATPAAPPTSLAAAPAARLRAKELGVELSSVRGTGPGGLVTKADVERFAAEREKTSGHPGK
jgi:pyruvate dehydrogenase E2 component (dihydrolipoamide acetyltransferase)